MNCKDIEFQIGDIVSFKSNDWFGRLIKKVTRGPVTHTGIIQDVTSKAVYISEMGPRGIELNKLVKLSSKGRKVHSVHRVGYLNRLTLLRIRREINKKHLKNVKYDFRGLFEFIFPWVDDRKEKFYCSELVFAVIKEYLHTYPKKYDEKISPNELYRFLETDKYISANKIIRIYKHV